MNNGAIAAWGAANGRAASSREIELLLCCARARLDAQYVEQMQALVREPIAWDDIIRLAQRHRLLPLLHWHLDKIASDSVPSSVLASLREQFTRHVRRTLLLTGQLREVLRLLAANGIAALAYKGPVLSQYLYGDVALRDFGDLDILVRKQDVLRAREILSSRGYRLAVPLSHQQDASILRSGCNYPLVHETLGVVIELHWTPEASISPAALEGFWERLEHVSLGGEAISTFRRDDLLLLLCMHGCRHMWERMEWICGIAELIRMEGVSWTPLLKLATSLGGTRALFVGLALAHDLLQAPVPEEVLRQAHADPEAGRLADLARRHLFRETEIKAHRLGLPFHLFQLRSKERLRDRLRYVYERTHGPSQDDWSSVPLPDRFFRFYAAIRPIRLIGAYGVRLFRSQR